MLLRPATQGSAFKDAVVAGIVERPRERSIFIQVVDLTALPDVDESRWDAIVVLHTIEYGNAPGPLDDVQEVRHDLISSRSSGARHARAQHGAPASASIDRSAFHASTLLSR
jgi:hypothetical protein